VPDAGPHEEKPLVMTTQMCDLMTDDGGQFYKSEVCNERLGDEDEWRGAGYGHRDPIAHWKQNCSVTGNRGPDPVDGALPEPGIGLHAGADADHGADSHGQRQQTGNRTECRGGPEQVASKAATSRGKLISSQE
jgi:hypothetical protein